MLTNKTIFGLIGFFLCSSPAFLAEASSDPPMLNGSTSTILYDNNTNTDQLFYWEDYSVLAVVLIVSCAIGIFYGYFGEKQTSSDDFLLGGSSMGTFPMALSLGASYVTAIELLGNPAEMYVAGAQFWMICVAFVLVVPVTSRLYLPVFMRLRLTSCYEYLEIRFCRAIRMYASALYMIQMIWYTAVAVYAPALALSDATGLNTYLAVTIIYAVCIFYASQGGMKAVIVTDTFLTAVLLISLAVILSLGVGQVSGYDFVWDYASKTNRLHFFDMNPDPTERHSFWSVVIGGTVYWVSMFCANQASIQKFLSVERIAQARVALWIAIIGLVTIYSVNFVTGAVLAAFYTNCDPIQAMRINASDRLLPLFVVQQLGNSHGVPGLFVAGIFAASLGTVATALNSLSAIACQDIATGYLGITISEYKGATVARWVCLCCGVVSFVLVFAVERLGPVLQLALSFNGMVGGVLLGLFTLGMVFPWTNSKGAATGGAIGLLFVAIAGGGAQVSQITQRRLPTSVDGCPASYNLSSVKAINDTENYNESVFWMFRISYLWYSGMGCVTTIVVGLLVSIFTSTTDPAEVPIDLLSPLIVKFLNRLPYKLKKMLKVPRQMGVESRRNSSLRPPSLTDDKDTRRRRRLSELAGGVFYSDNESLAYDNHAIRLEYDKIPHDDGDLNNTTF